MRFWKLGVAQMIALMIPAELSAQAEVLDVVDALVRNDDQISLRTFASGTEKGRRVLAGDCAGLDNYDLFVCEGVSQAFQEQVSERIYQRVIDGEEYAFIELETCGVRVERYGVPSVLELYRWGHLPDNEASERAFLNELNLMSVIDATRLSVALEAYDIELDYSENVMSFRSPERMVRLNDQLNSSSANTVLFAFDPPGECGAGANFVEMANIESFNEIIIIPSFFFNLCQVNGVSPWDLNTCAGALVNPQAISSGSWRYRARLSDCFVEGRVDTEVLIVDQDTDRAIFSIPTSSC